MASHPQWIIARTSAQARAALVSGKQVLVLALEGNDGILDTEEDLKEFVDQKGVRVVTLLHLTDDQYGGVAFLRGIRGLATPWAWLTQLLHPLHTEEGVRVNRNGLSERGREQTRALIKRGVWIDLSHASDQSTRAVVELLDEAKLPALYTHTALRKYLGAERGISSEQLEMVKRTGGIIGLMPSEEMTEGTPTDLCGPHCGDPNTCRGGVRALAVQYREAVAALGADSVSMGSDYNGGIPHLRPTCPVGAGLDMEGLWNIGQVPELWKSLELMKMPVPEPRSLMVEKFLKAWERVERASLIY